MADYYTRFSLVLDLPSQEAQEYALDIHHQARQASEGDEPPPNFPPSLAEQLDVWQFEMEVNKPARQHRLWLHSEEGGVDAVCAFIQHLLEKFHPTGRVTFEWSFDCSKPRTYGGGAAIITAQNIRSMSTGQWLTENTV